MKGRIVIDIADDSGMLIQALNNSDGSAASKIAKSYEEAEKFIKEQISKISLAAQGYAIVDKIQ